MNLATRTSRISWPAIFASMVIVLATQLLFGLVGLSIGAGNVNPATESHPFAGIGSGVGIWIGLTTLLTLFAGGWIAAKLAGVHRKLDGIMHGTVGWGLATLATFYVLSTAAGGIVRATSGVAGGLLNLAGQGVSAVGRDQQRRTFDEASAKASQLTEEAGARSREMGQAAADATAQTAGWTAAFLLLGLLASAFGGYTGAMRDDDAEAHASGLIEDTRLPVREVRSAS